MSGNVKCPKCGKQTPVMGWSNGEFKELPMPFTCDHCDYEFSKCDYKGSKCKIYGGIKHPVYESNERGFPTDKKKIKYACIECEFEFFDDESE